jgi:hypothetical protein
MQVSVQVHLRVRLGVCAATPVAVSCRWWGSVQVLLATGNLRGKNLGVHLIPQAENQRLLYGDLSKLVVCLGVQVRVVQPVGLGGPSALAGRASESVAVNSHHWQIMTQGILQSESVFCSNLKFREVARNVRVVRLSRCAAAGGPQSESAVFQD